MPELPEVESIALGLRQIVVGREVERVWVGAAQIIRGPCRRRWRRCFAALAGGHVEHVIRRGKRLILTLDGRVGLVFQLGMTGKFLWSCPQAGPATADAKHIRLVVSFRDETELVFVDPRRFGRVWGVPDLDLEHPDVAMEAAGLTPLGPEALEIGLPAFKGILRTARPIKPLLLDQGRIAGLGNIYADESLWATCIHPSRTANTLTDAEAARLLRQIKSVLRRAIRAGGTTFSNFGNSYGEIGRFRSRLNVYGRAGEPCRRCDGAIERCVLGGRGTHLCPRCQAR